MGGGLAKNKFIIDLSFFFRSNSLVASQLSSLFFSLQKINRAIMSHCTFTAWRQGILKLNGFAEWQKKKKKRSMMFENIFFFMKQYKRNTLLTNCKENKKEKKKCL